MLGRLILDVADAAEGDHVLRTHALDEMWPRRRQLEALLGGEDAYVAVVRNGCYRRLVPRLTGVTAIVRALVLREPDA